MLLVFQLAGSLTGISILSTNELAVLHNKANETENQSALSETQQYRGNDHQRELLIGSILYFGKRVAFQLNFLLRIRHIADYFPTEACREADPICMISLLRGGSGSWREEDFTNSLSLQLTHDSQTCLTETIHNLLF